MNSLIDKNKFIKIFCQKKYREKLDQIILNFFGLDVTSKIKNNEDLKNQVILEIFFFIDKNYILKIIIKDNKHLFKESKKFYINFSYEKKLQNYILLYPCYWEFYCENCLKQRKIKKSLENIAALLFAKNINEIKMILNNLKSFNEEEINDIINIVRTD